MVGRRCHGVVMRRVARDEHQRRRAAVTVARPAAAVHEAKDCLRRLMHRGVCDGDAGAMGQYPIEGGACGSGTCGVGPGGRALTPHAGP
jgi:hypothetical protein